MLLLTRVVRDDEQVSLVTVGRPWLRALIARAWHGGWQAVSKDVAALEVSIRAMIGCHDDGQLYQNETKQCSAAANVCKAFGYGGMHARLRY